jgi:hypothetical protein
MAKITLSRTELSMHISPANLVQALLAEDKKLYGDLANNNFVIRVAVTLKRCGVETKLIVEQRCPSRIPKPRTDSLRAIQEALQKALIWNNALFSGAVNSTMELAVQSGVSQRYVTQIIKLAYLSPSIISRIFKGNIPHDLTLGKLKRQVPLGWVKQESLFS